MYRSDISISTLAAGTAAAVLLFATAYIISDGANADPVAPGEASFLVNASSRPLGMLIEQGPLRAQAEPGDDIAALEAVEIALTQAGDGAAYVWRRGNGRLVGAVRPTSTFRDVDRRMCRHIEIEMRLGAYARRAEGIACRGSDGVWLLEG